MSTAQRRISEALKTRHGMKPHPSYQFGDKVRIWREDLNCFAGPYTVQRYDNEGSVCVRTDKIRPFSTTVVRLFTEEEITDSNYKSNEEKSNHVAFQDFRSPPISFFTIM